MRVHPTGKAGGSVAFVEPDTWGTEYEPARLEFLVSDMKNSALESQARGSEALSKTHDQKRHWILLLTYHEFAKVIAVRILERILKL
jgi:hypothetical protein